MRRYSEQAEARGRGAGAAWARRGRVKKSLDAKRESTATRQCTHRGSQKQPCSRSTRGRLTAGYGTGAVRSSLSAPVSLGCGGALLEFDAGASRFELGLCLLGVLLGHPLDHGLGSAVDQVLGLLEAQVGERAHLLDDLDLLVAGAGEDDVELVLLLLGGCATTVATPGRSGGAGHGHRRGGGDAEA